MPHASLYNRRKSAHAHVMAVIFAGYAGSSVTVVKALQVISDCLIV